MANSCPQINRTAIWEGVNRIQSSRLLCRVFRNFVPATMDGPPAYFPL